MEQRHTQAYPHPHEVGGSGAAGAAPGVGAASGVGTAAGGTRRPGGLAATGGGRIGWLDCAAGASGDMFLGALVDVGVELSLLQQAVSSLPTEPITLRAHRVERHSIAATKVDVQTAALPAHRTWADVRKLLDGADLAEPARALAHDTFARLARAEAQAHRIDVDDVHFHEVGALDAIADVVGAAAGLVSLGLDRLAVGVITLGSGRARGSHGGIPVPGPATLSLLGAVGAPCVGGPTADEMCTPTGAALIAAAATDFGALPRMRPLTVGNGAGGRDVAELPNLLRMVIGDPI
ncbi:MAG: LarC family nickel insertion protein [Mycobacteriales bacterium]